MIKDHEVFVDPLYAFVEDKIRRFENVLGFRIPNYIIIQIAYDLKRLYKNNAKYKYSTSSIIALLYHYKIISYREALQLLEIYSAWRKRFRQTLRLIKENERAFVQMKTKNKKESL